MVADATFSHWALSNNLNNTLLSLALSVGIGVFLGTASIALNLKSIDKYFKLDKDNSGSVSFTEWFWFGIKTFVITLAVMADISTNYLGMDTAGASQLTPLSFFPGWVVALTLALLMMILPIAIIALVDVNLQTIAEAKPKAEMKMGQLQGNQNYASGYREEVNMNTRSAGQQAGQKDSSNWKLDI